MKTYTQGDIDELKRQWREDPCWDIEDTEGFEAHREELKAYRLEMEAYWKNYANQKLLDRAIELGCSPQLVRYIETLERRIARLETQS